MVHDATRDSQEDRRARRHRGQPPRATLAAGRRRGRTHLGRARVHCWPALD